MSSENDDETSDDGDIPFMPYPIRITRPPPKSRRCVVEESGVEQVYDGRETSETGLDEESAKREHAKVENKDTELLATSPESISQDPPNRSEPVEELATKQVHEGKEAIETSLDEMLAKNECAEVNNDTELLATSPESVSHDPANRSQLVEESSTMQVHDIKITSESPSNEISTKRKRSETDDRETRSLRPGPKRLKITMKSLQNNTKQPTPKKTQEEEFAEVERLMSAGRTSRALDNIYEPMTRKGGQLSIGRPKHWSPIRPFSHRKRMQPSQAAQKDRINAFRGQLEAAGGFVGTRAEASIHLRRYNWDVDCAVSEWQREHQRRLGEVDVEPDEFSEEEELHAHRPMIARRSGEEERRDVTEVLVQRLQKASNCHNLTLTRYDTIGLLHQHHFDIDEAIERYVISDGDIDEIRMMYQPFRRRNPSQRQQDLRLAEYLDITATNDWFTARELLKNLGWDLAKALAMWQQNRVHHVPHPDSVRRGWGKQAKQRVDKGFRRDTEGKVQKDVERLNETAIDPRLVFEGGKDEKQCFKYEEELNSGPEDDDDDRQYQDNQEGAPVGSRGIAKLGAPNPNLLSVEYIRNGEYKRSHWSSGRYGFTTDLDESESPARSEGSRRRGRVAFDWNDTEHIRDLNTWRNQRYCRLKGERESERVAWLPAEQDYLRELHHQLKAQRLRADPHCFDEQRKMIITAETKKDWVKRFNDKFAGKVVKGFESEGYRPVRSWGSIQSQRSRLQDLCEEFDFNYSEPHPDSPKQSSLIKMTPNDEKESKKGRPYKSESSCKRKRDATEGSDDEEYFPKPENREVRGEEQRPAKRLRQK